jgi:hypothetical protein
MSNFVTLSDQQVEIPILEAVNGIKKSKQHTFTTSNVDARREVKDPADKIEIKRRRIIEKYRIQKASVIGNTKIRLTPKGSIIDAINTVISQKVSQFTKSITMTLIKDLMKDLVPGDEVELGQAVEVVKEERKTRYPTVIFHDTDDYIEKFFKLIGTKIQGFQFVRLKKTIRCVADISAHLSQIDELFEEWDQQTIKT